MKQQLLHSIGLRVLAMATASAATVGVAPAQPGAVIDLNVAVHASHYAFGGRAFDDVDDLGAAIDAMRPRAVGIVACGPNTTRALMAAAHRLRGSPLHLRVYDGDDPACSNQAAVTLTVAGRGLRFDDEAVDRYWRSIAP